MFRIAELLGALTLGALFAIASGGCVGPEAPPPEPITVVLTNWTDLDVRPNFHASGSATDAAGLFVAANRRTDFTDRAFPELRAHETVTLTLECDEISSLGSDAPVLFDATQLIVTPSADRVFLLRGTDFDCGNSLRFVYFTEDGVFHVRVEAQ